MKRCAWCPPSLRVAYAAGQGHAISSAVYVTACGMVGSIQLLAKDDMAALERLQVWTCRMPCLLQPKAP